MYPVTFTGRVFITWYTQTTCIRITFRAFVSGDLHDCAFKFYFLNKFSIAMWQLLTWCSSDQAATPCIEMMSTPLRLLSVAMRVMTILDILLLHCNVFEQSGAVRAAAGSKQSPSYTEKTLLSSPLNTRLSQHLDHNIHQAINVRITAKSFPVNL